MIWRRAIFFFPFYAEVGVLDAFSDKPWLSQINLVHWARDLLWSLLGFIALIGFLALTHKPTPKITLPRVVLILVAEIIIWGVVTYVFLPWVGWK